MKRMTSLVLLLIFLISLCGCNDMTIEDADVKKEYGRASISEKVESFGFGDGRSDAIYIALDYIYNDKEIMKDCGNDFEVSLSNIITHSDDAILVNSYRYFEGQADYSIEIDEYLYRIKLSKERYGKWEVNECFLENK